MYVAEGITPDQDRRHLLPDASPQPAHTLLRAAPCSVIRAWVVYTGLVGPSWGQIRPDLPYVRWSGVSPGPHRSWIHVKEAQGGSGRANGSRRLAGSVRRGPWDLSSREGLP